MKTTRIRKIVFAEVIIESVSYKTFFRVLDKQDIYLSTNSLSLSIYVYKKNLLCLQKTTALCISKTFLRRGVMLQEAICFSIWIKCCTNKMYKKSLSVLPLNLHHNRCCAVGMWNIFVFQSFNFLLVFSSKPIVILSTSIVCDWESFIVLIKLFLHFLPKTTSNDFPSQKVLVFKISNFVFSLEHKIIFFEIEY